MSTTSWQNRLYAQLLRDAQRGAIQRHCAYLVAGWFSLFLIRPSIGKRRPTSVSAVLGGGVLLVLLLLLAGPILNTLQPVLHAAGTLPGVTWLLVAAVALLAWRYLVGRSVLRAFEDAVSEL